MKHLVFAIALLCSAVGFAADPKQPAGEPEWMKHSKPGEGHKVLNDLVGKWNYTSRWWTDAAAKPEEAKGTSTSKWILGGRYVQEDMKGKAMGQPFNGIGITGFDNFKQEYQVIWMDDMSTGMMTGSGTMDAASKTITTTGTGSDPMKGEKNSSFKSVLKMVSKNEHTFEMYTKGADGKEYKAMEIQYTRAK